MLNQIWCDAYVCVCACRRWMVTVTLLSSRCSGWKSCVFMYDSVGIRVWCAGLWLRMRQACSGQEIRSPHPVLVVCWSQELRQFPGKAPVSDTSVTWYSLRRPPARSLARSSLKSVSRAAAYTGKYITFSLLVCVHVYVLMVTRFDSHDRNRYCW